MTRIYPYNNLVCSFVMLAFGAISASAQLPPGQNFGDVPQTDPEYAATTTLFQLGISVGCDNVPDFCPGQYLLRQDMAAFIVRAWSARVYNNPEGFPTNPNAPQYFSDVPSGNSQYKYVEKLYELGITTGTSAPTIDQYGNLTGPGVFSPATTLVNYQIAVFLSRARTLADNGCTAGYYGAALKPFTVSADPNCAQNGFPSNPSEAPYFSDVCSPTAPFLNCPEDPVDYYFIYIQRVADLNVFTSQSHSSVTSTGPGCGNCIFGENNTITRAQMAIWTVQGMGLYPESILSMHNPDPGVTTGPNVWSTLPTITVGFTFTLNNQSTASIGYGQFLLSNTSGNIAQNPKYCYGSWWQADLKLYDASPMEATDGSPLADSFCTVSLVSVANLPNNNGVQATVNFTFAPSAQGATYNVFHNVIYNQGNDPWENVGTITVGTPTSAVTLTDLTTMLGSPYYAGDSWALTVSGTAGQSVAVSGDGGATQFAEGTIPQNGILTIPGTWQSTNIGLYSQIWYVAGVPAAGLSFQIAVAPAPTCTGLDSKYLGTVSVTGVPAQWTIVVEGASRGSTVKLLVWNETQTITGATTFTAPAGSSTVTLNSASFTQLGSYTVMAQVTGDGASTSCPGAAFFSVFDNSKQPGRSVKTSCSSMAGTWTSPSSRGPLALTQNGDGTITGTATANFPVSFCGTAQTATWPITSSGVASGSATLNFGAASPATLTCGVPLTTSEIHNINFTSAVCDAATDSATGYYSDGTSEKFSANLTSGPAVPTGETSTFYKWDAVAGYSTQALFSMTLPALTNGEQFGGRTVQESATALTDGCNALTGNADVPAFTASRVNGVWFVQKNDQYYYDSLGYDPAFVRYYQTYAGSNCNLQATQAMSIFSDGTASVVYSTHPIVVAVTSGSVSATRDTATSGTLAYPAQ